MNDQVGSLERQDFIWNIVLLLRSWGPSRLHVLGPLLLTPSFPLRARLPPTLQPTPSSTNGSGKASATSGEEDKRRPMPLSRKPSTPRRRAATANAPQLPQTVVREFIIYSGQSKSYKPKPKPKKQAPPEKELPPPPKKTGPGYSKPWLQSGVPNKQPSTARSTASTKPPLPTQNVNKKPRATSAPLPNHHVRTDVVDFVIPQPSSLVGSNDDVSDGDVSVSPPPPPSTGAVVVMSGGKAKVVVSNDEHRPVLVLSPPTTKTALESGSEEQNSGDHSADQAEEESERDTILVPSGHVPVQRSLPPPAQRPPTATNNNGHSKIVSSTTSLTNNALSSSPPPPPPLVLTESASFSNPSPPLPSLRASINSREPSMPFSRLSITASHSPVIPEEIDSSSGGDGGGGTSTSVRDSNGSGPMLTWAESRQTPIHSVKLSLSHHHHHHHHSPTMVVSTPRMSARGDIIGVAKPAPILAESGTVRESHMPFSVENRDSQKISNSTRPHNDSDDGANTESDDERSSDGGIREEFIKDHVPMETNVVQQSQQHQRWQEQKNNETTKPETVSSQNQSQTLLRQSTTTTAIASAPISARGGDKEVPDQGTNESNPPAQREAELRSESTSGSDSDDEPWDDDAQRNEKANPGGQNISNTTGGLKLERSVFSHFSGFDIGVKKKSPKSEDKQRPATRGSASPLPHGKPPQSAVGGARKGSASSVRSQTPSTASRAVTPQPSLKDRVTYSHIYKSFEAIFHTDFKKAADITALMQDHLRMIEEHRLRVSQMDYVDCAADRPAMYYRTQAARPEVCEIVNRALYEIRCWNHISEEFPYWNLMWWWSKPRIEWSRLLVWQRMNHFPNARQITRKDNLNRTLMRYRRLPGKVGDTFDIFPTTYNMPADFFAFVDEFTKLDEDKRQGAPITNLWIMKPSAMSRGRGISIVTDLSNVVRGESNVIQRYIDRPLLIDTHKFDLRLYVLVTSFSPLEAFLYKDGFARLSAQPYSLDPKDLSNLFVHLTNSAVNQDSDAIQNVIDVDNEDAGGSKLNLSYLKTRLAERGISFDAQLWPQIIQVIVKSLCCGEDGIQGSVNCFELFGYDILIDESLRAWLIEINASPSLECTTEVDHLIKDALIQDIIRLVDPLYFDLNAFEKVLQRRLLERSSKRIVKNAQEQLDNDLRDILRGRVPRQYGETPAHVGRFERIAPSPLYDKITKLKRM